MPGTRARVTVGMAVYRGAPHIAAAIRSILAQDYTDWELLLVNDCTPDNSVEIVEGFDDPRIRLIHNETNEGLVAVRNRIMTEATGEFIAWLDQDDLAAPNRLSVQMSFLDANRHISACGSVTKMLIHTEGQPDRTATSLLPLRHRDIRAAIPFLNPMACNTVTMRRADFENAGLRFRPPFGNSLDYDMWSLASDRLLFANLPQVLGAYRIHGGQTSQGAALDIMNDHALRVQSDIIERALGITMTTEQRTTHRSATIAPLDIPDVERLNRVAEWFALLRNANKVERGFDPRAFDQALARQWTTALLAARESLGGKEVAKQSLPGTWTVRPGVVALASSIVKGAKRRRAQREVGSAVT